MITLIVRSIVASSAISWLPALGNIKILSFPQIWIMFFLTLIAFILQPKFKVVFDKNNQWDHGTEIQIIWSVYLTQLLAVCEATYLNYPDSMQWSIFTVMALIVILTGLALRTWAIYAMGRFFTMHLSIQTDHKVIRVGPYKYIRHPSYVGAFFIYLGFPVFLHSWISLAAAAILLPAAWLRRIHHEEKMLFHALGDDYQNYSQSVKKVIPGLW